MQISIGAMPDKTVSIFLFISKQSTLEDWKYQVSKE